MFTCLSVSLDRKEIAIGFMMHAFLTYSWGSLIRGKSSRLGTAVYVFNYRQNASQSKVWDGSRETKFKIEGEAYLKCCSSSLRDDNERRASASERTFCAFEHSRAAHLI